MGYLSTGEKYSHIANLIAIAKSDGVVNLAELSYIAWVAKKLGVSQLELTRIIEKEPPFRKPLMENDRLHQFHQFLNLIYVDAVVDKRELHKCEELGLQLGLAKTGINKLIARASEVPPRMLEFDEVKQLYSSF